MEIQERKKDLIANVLEGDTVDKVLSEAEIVKFLEYSFKKLRN